MVKRIMEILFGKEVGEKFLICAPAMVAFMFMIVIFGPFEMFLNNPLAFKPYKSIRDRQNDYYRINVRNYAVFYVVIEDVMEVRRFVYSKRNLPEII